MAASEKVVRTMDACRAYRELPTMPALGLNDAGQALPPTSFEGTVETLRSHENLHNAPPKSATTFTLAYDRGQNSMLLSALQSGDVELIHNALASATSGFMTTRTPDLSYKAQEVTGLLEECALLSAQGATSAIQRMALRFLCFVLSTTSSYRPGLLTHAPIAAAITAGLDDADPVKRKYTYEAVGAAAETGQGAEACVSMGLVTHLVARVREEVAVYAQGGPVNRQPLDGALLALQRLLANTQTDAAGEAIRAHAVAALVEVLHVRGGTRSTLASALKCLGYLAVEQAGKEAVCAEERAGGAVGHLLTLVQCDDAAVIAGAASVLTGTFLEDECKRVVLDHEAGLGPFLDVLEARQSDDGEVPDLPSRPPQPRPAGRRHLLGSHLEVTQARINACTALATVAAHPRARAALRQPPLDAPRRLKSAVAAAETSAVETTTPGGSASAGAGLLMQVATAAKRAHDTITWDP